jgi:hypothetical protein
LQVIKKRFVALPIVTVHQTNQEAAWIFFSALHRRLDLVNLEPAVG